MPIIFSLFAGIIFGAGLTVSDMVNPARVLNFLDLAGSWDPTLVFVMAGGLGVTGVGYRLIFHRGAPLIGTKFNLPTIRKIDLPLVGGAAVFGIGWGLAGICPGPALADLATLEPKVLFFIAAMLVGMLVARTWPHRLSAMKLLRRILTLSAAFSAFIAVAAVQAQESGDIQQGRQLAVDVCASCHAVRAGQTRPPLATAPGFQEIADTPGMTAIALSIWLKAQSHPTMPNFILSSRQVGDVSAYILSLRH